MTAFAQRPVGGWRMLMSRMSVRDVMSLTYVLGIAVCLEMAIRFVPLRALVRAVGVSLTTTPTSGIADRPSLTQVEHRRLRWARAIMARWPFGAGTCLRRSLVIGHVVRRLEPTVRIGVARDGEGVGAHAWLEVPGAVNVGGGHHHAFRL